MNMDQSLSRMGSKDGPTSAELMESCKSTRKLSGEKSKPQLKPVTSLESGKSNKNRPMSPLAKQKTISPVSTSSLAAKSKIPGMSRQPKTSLSLKDITASQTSSNTGDVTQKTSSPISLAKPNSNKTELSNSKSSLTAKALNTTNFKDLQKPLVTDFKRPGIQRRTDSNMSRRSTSSMATGSQRRITSTAGNLSKMDILERKLTDVQTEFFKSFETMKATKQTEKFPKEYKFISLIRNDACKLIIKDDQLRKMPQKLPVNSVGDFKEKVKTNLNEYFTSIVRVFKESSESGPEDRENRLRDIEDASTKDIFELIDDLCASYKEDTNDVQQMAKMQKDLQEAKKSLKLAETKLIEVNKENEEKLAELERNSKTKSSEELSRKEGQIKDLQKKVKSLEKQNDILKSTIQNCEKEDLMDKTNLQEELKSCRESLNSIQKKLSTSEQLLSNERKDLKSKNEIIKKLESDLLALNTKMEETKTKHKADNKSPEYLRQISELRKTVVGLENEKGALEKKIEELNSETSSNNDLGSKLRDAEHQLEILQQKLAESERPTEAKPECSIDAQSELTKLQESESEKRREIEKLKMELSKALFQVDNLEGQNQRDHQLLELYSELINSLQTNDKTLRIQVEELIGQMGEKNSAVNELTGELRSKSDEYRELYTAVNAKQLELSNQTHMIKLLEESNERCKMLRVKQEEKIAQMGEDIMHLKQTIAFFKANILSGNPKLVYPPIMPPRLHEDYNENFHYYISERKRKRQIDINVKKYEA